MWTPSLLTPQNWWRVDAGLLNPTPAAPSFGDTLLSWTDSIGGIVASQSTAGYRPLYVRDGAGRPVVRWDGVDDHMLFASEVSGRTWVLVLSAVGNPGNFQFPIWSNTSNDGLILDPGTYTPAIYNSANVLAGTAYRDGVTGASVGATSLVRGTGLGQSVYVITAANPIHAEAMCVQPTVVAPDREWTGDYSDVLCFSQRLNALEVKNLTKYLNRLRGVYPGDTTFRDPLEG